MPGAEYQPLHSDASTAPHKPVIDKEGERRLGQFSSMSFGRQQSVLLFSAGRVIDYVLEDSAVPWSTRDGPATSVVVDFAPVPLTFENGPVCTLISDLRLCLLCAHHLEFYKLALRHSVSQIRFVKGTQNSRSMIPSLAEESWSSKTCTICPAPAGTAVFRDPRTW